MQHANTMQVTHLFKKLFLHKKWIKECYKHLSNILFFGKSFQKKLLNKIIGACFSFEWLRTYLDISNHGKTPYSILMISFWYDPLVLIVFSHETNHFGSVKWKRNQEIAPIFYFTWYFYFQKDHEKWYNDFLYLPRLFNNLKQLVKANKI